MKKFGILLLLLLLAALPAWAAEENYAWEQDFDGDGEAEQFVFCGESKMLSVEGKLSYVDGSEETVLAETIGLLPEQCAAWQMADCWLFKAEEGYGIGSTVSHVYSITPEGIRETNGIFSGLEWMGAQDFRFMFPDTDLREDKSGNTEKPYYVCWQDGWFIEYGGAFIPTEELAQFEGGEKFLKAVKNSGNMLKSVYYRKNGIINVTYCDGMVNGNATLILDGNTLVLLDRDGDPLDETSDLEFSDFGGVYREISGAVRYTAYPEKLPTD